MYSTPSRKDKRQTRFYYLAEHGNSFSSELLYKSEMDFLRRNGFTISIQKNSELKNLYYCKISWENPFKDGIPYLVNQYTLGIIKTFPINFVKNFAQELYVISQRKLQIKK